MEPIELVFRSLVWIAYFCGLYFLVFWLLYYLENYQRLKKELNTIYDLKKPQPVTIVVPAYNEEATIEKTLQSIIAMDYPKTKLKVLVVNDGSKDRTKDIVNNFIKAHKGHNVELLNQKNQGKAAALNAALKTLSTEYFVCMDADSFIEPDALRQMMARFEADPDLALLTPVMKVHSPKNWLQKFQRLEYMSAMLVIKLMGYMDANYVAPGPFSSYKTEVIREVGGFDETSLVEDQEIAYRVQKAHYKIRQCVDAVVHTVAPESFRELDKQRNRWFKGTLLNLFKYRSIVFNKKYGDFGFFQMPFTFVAYILAMLLMTSFVWYFIRPIIRQIKDLWLIRFDILPYIQNFRFTFTPLDMDVGASFIMYILLMGAIVMMTFSSRMTKDPVFKDGKIHLVPYLFVYFIMLSYIAVKVCFEVMIGKKQKW